MSLRRYSGHAATPHRTQDVMKLREDGAVSCDAPQEVEGESEEATETEEQNATRREIIALHQKGEADAILSLISTFNEDKTRPWDPLLLWARPQSCCLSALAAHVRAANISAVVSVGCGTGLLEWLIQATTGLSVVGYEVNVAWWTSKYAPPTFIPLTYVDQDAAPPKVPPTHALMCCYFNNGKVFRQYVSAYEGPVLLIIGATSGDRHTDPHPLDYVDEGTWRLTLTHRISSNDLLAGYHRHHVHDQPGEEAHHSLKGT